MALQIEAIQRWAANTGNPVTEWYVDDGVKSEVPVIERTGGGRMFREASLGNWKGIVVYDTDRWGREPSVNHGAMKLVRDLGLAFVDLSEPGTDLSTDSGELMFTIKSGVARYEHQKILRRMNDGRAVVVEQGAWVGGITPYGYGIVIRQKRKYLFVNEAPIEGLGWSEAEVVRRMFRWAAIECLSWRSIAARLNTLRVPTHCRLPDRANSRQASETAGIWRASAVRSILTNPTYKGVHIWGRRNPDRKPGIAPTLIERTQPLIIDEELWEQTNAHRADNPRNRKNRYLLTGKIICLECGHRYVGTQKPTGNPPPGSWGYVCGARRSAKDYGYPCKQSKAVREWIEESVWERVRWAIDHPEEVIDQLLAEITEESQGSNHWQEEQDALWRLLGEIERRRGRAEEAYLAGAMPLNRYQLRLEEFTAEEAELNRQVEDYQSRLDRLLVMDEQLEAIGDALSALREATATATWEDKRFAIERLVDRVEIGTPVPGRGTRPPVWVVIAWHRFGEAPFADIKTWGAVHNRYLFLRLVA